MVVFAAARLLCSNNRIKVRKGVAKAKTVKRMASVVLLVCFMLAFSCPTILAAEAQETTTIVPCEDGGYIVTTLTIEPSTSRASGTTSGSKTVTKYNVFDVKQYSFTVHGTFTYNGSAATATSASTSYTIYQSGWSCTNRSTTKDRDTITGTATFRNGIAVNYPTATLTCSPTGNVS